MKSWHFCYHGIEGIFILLNCGHQNSSLPSMRRLCKAIKWLAGPVVLLLGICAGLSIGPTPVMKLRLAHAAPADVPADPVVFGAWLYKAHCVRCHGDYDQERLASEFDDDQELRNAFEGGNCRIKWGRRYGGKLGHKEMVGLVDFMRAWEDNDGPLDLPELPPMPASNLPPLPKPKAKTALAEDEPGETMDPVLKELLEINPVAHGAWLYTQHCYRCHLIYEKARSGRGFTEETIRKTIASGKTSTQMTPFSRMLGGKLSNREISGIVNYIMTFEKFGEAPALAEIVTQPPKADPAALLPIGLPRFPKVVGDLTNGARLYALNCTRCHGVSGEGYAGRRLAKTWMVLRPDLLVKSILKKGVPGSSMPAWSQNRGGPFSAKEIEDVVTAVLDWDTAKMVSDNEKLLLMGQINLK
jgi:mono/diheme cytochrome c family protein